jgi:hypothetical protein
MAIDRCVAILTPLKAGKIRVSFFIKYKQNLFDLNRYFIYVAVHGF